MFNGTKAVCISGVVAIGVWLLTGNLPAQSSNARRITLQEVQAQASGSKLPDLARLTVDVAKYHRRAVQADYWPKIDGGFVNLHFNKFMGATFELARRSGELPILGKNQNLGWVNLTQPVTPLLQVRQAVSIARADETIAQAKANQINTQVARELERNYFELLIAQRQQTAAETRINRIETGLQIATTGAAPLEGMAERRAAFLSASKDLITASSRVTELTRSLNALIGFAPETELELIPPEPEIENISLQEVSQQALANSVEVVAAEQTVHKAEAGVKLSKLAYMPQVAVVGGYAYQTVIPAVPLDFTYIGFIATVNVFDFGKRENTMSERSSELALARANVDLVKAKVAANAQKAFLDLQQKRKLRDLMRQMASNYQITTVSYQNSSLETSADRAQAEADMFRAELDYREAYSQLKGLIEGRY